MIGRVLLVTGSRALNNAADQPRCVAILSAFAAAFAPTVIVAGDADGPDDWAIEYGVGGGLVTRIYALDSWVRDAGHRAIRRWHEREPPYPRSWPLERNEAMVRAVAHQAAQGWAVEVLALEAAWSATKGTDHTVNRALSHGLAVTHVLVTRARGIERTVDREA